VLPWSRAAPDLYAAIVLDEGGLYLLMVIVFVVVAAGILNTILMSVMERTKEFGVFLALGATPRSLVQVVLAEATLLGVLSVGLGLALGFWGHHYFATEGLNFREVFGASYEASGILLPDKFYSILAPVQVIRSALVIVALVLIGAVYPAARAARLQPMEAIRHV
jgi:ABC-type antimicrobial peptide transport system permease subunit